MSAFFRKNKAHLAGMLAVFLLLTFSAAAIMMLLQPSEYEASSSILIRQGKRQAGAEMQAELALLQSDALARQVLDAVGEKRLFPQPGQEDRKRQFQQHLAVHPVRSTRIVEITFRHAVPELALQVVSTVVSLFGQALEQQDDPQKILLEEELLLRRKQMQQAQNVLAMFRQNDRLYEGDYDWQMRYLEIKRGRLEVVLEEEAKKEDALAKELAELRQQFAVLPAGDAESREAYLKMKLYRLELLRKYEAKEPLIAEVDKQLAQLKQQLQADTAVEKLADQIAQASAALALQQTERESAQRELNQLADSLTQQAEQRKIFSSLEAEVEKSRELYAQQLNKVEESRKAGVQEGYVTVIEQPQMPLKTVRSKKMLLRNIVLAAALGLLGSLLWGIFRQRRSNNRIAAGEER